MNGDDIDTVRIIEDASFPLTWSLRYFLKEFEKSSQHFFVAEENNLIIGYIGLETVSFEAYILKIAVLPEYRRQKVASRLLKFIIDKFTFLQKIQLEVRENNHSAIKFYQALGFTETEVKEKYYYDTDEDALILSLHLDGK